MSQAGSPSIITSKPFTIFTILEKDKNEWMRINSGGSINIKVLKVAAATLALIAVYYIEFGGQDTAFASDLNAFADITKDVVLVLGIVGAFGAVIKCAIDCKEVSKALKGASQPVIEEGRRQIDQGEGVSPREPATTLESGLAVVQKGAELGVDGILIYGGVLEKPCKLISKLCEDDYEICDELATAAAVVNAVRVSLNFIATTAELAGGRKGFASALGKDISEIKVSRQDVGKMATRILDLTLVIIGFTGGVEIIYIVSIKFVVSTSKLGLEWAKRSDKVGQLLRRDARGG